MRYLFCPLASHGFVYPLIGIAERLRQRGHDVAFVTGGAFHETFGQLGIERIPCGPKDTHSFQVEHWFHALAIAIQVKHIEYAIDRFAPDVLVGNQLTLGPLIAGERQGLPVAVLGFASYLWPAWRGDRAPHSEREQRLLWRYGEMMDWYNQARRLFKLPPRQTHYMDTPLLGDLFLLQSVPELAGDVDTLPERVHAVGSCLWDVPQPDPELVDWLQQAGAAQDPVIYVQPGRHFLSPQFWSHLVAALADRPLRVVAAVGRMDTEVGALRANFFVRPYLSQRLVLPYAQAVVANGTTTAVLGALTHGLPSLLFPTGGEQLDLAEDCQRAGVALCQAEEHLAAEQVEAAIYQVLMNVEMCRNARALQNAFGRIDTAQRVTTCLECLALTGSPVLRAQLAPISAGPAKTVVAREQSAGG